MTEAMLDMKFHPRARLMQLSETTLPTRRYSLTNLLSAIEYMKKRMPWPQEEFLFIFVVF